MLLCILGDYYKLHKLFSNLGREVLIELFGKRTTIPSNDFNGENLRRRETNLLASHFCSFIDRVCKNHPKLLEVVIDMP